MLLCFCSHDNTIDVEKLPAAQRRFVKDIQRANDERVQEIFRTNYRNIAGLAILSTVALSIYLYTIFQVKQETILEEIDDEVSQELAAEKADSGK
uniref:Cytochrome c oxidase assembly factor 3 n=1 Tax=Syphacia muris TaxID=451379 RepID=A0A0N5AQZ6_9BILA